MRVEGVSALAKEEDHETARWEMAKQVGREKFVGKREGKISCAGKRRG